MTAQDSVRERYDRLDKASRSRPLSPAESDELYSCWRRIQDSNRRKEKRRGSK